MSNEIMDEEDVVRQAVKKAEKEAFKMGQLQCVNDMMRRVTERIDANKVISTSEVVMILDQQFIALTQEEG